MSLESIAALEALLPGSSHSKPAAADDTETVFLSEADIDSFGKFGHSGDDESDEEERGHGGGGVQCAQQ